MILIIERNVKLLWLQNYSTIQTREAFVVVRLRCPPIVSSIWILGPSYWHCLSGFRGSDLAEGGVSPETCFEISRAMPHFRWLSVLPICSSRERLAILPAMPVCSYISPPDGEGLDEGLLALWPLRPQETRPPVSYLKFFITAKRKVTSTVFGEVAEIPETVNLTSN